MRAAARLRRAAVLAVCALAIYGAAHATHRFHWFGVPAYTPGFADLRQLFSSSECANQGEDVFAENTCDEWKRPYTYSTLLLRGMQFLRLTRTDTNPVGLVLVFVSTLACALLLAPRTRRQFVLGLAVLASPSFLLGVERCNLDVVICAGLIGVGVLATASRLEWPEWLAIGLVIGGATFTKYYPLLAVAALLAIRRDRTERLRLVATSTALVVAYFLLIPADIGHIRTTVPAPGPSRFAFGALHLPHMLRFGSAERITSLIAGGLVILGGAWKGRASAPAAPDLDARTRAWMLLGCVVYLGCFVLQPNFDYRRVMLVLTVPALLGLAEAPAPRPRVAARTALVLMVTLLWAMLPGRLLSRVPDEALARSLSTGFLFVRQALDWGFIFVLSFCASAAWRLPGDNQPGETALDVSSS